MYTFLEPSGNLSKLESLSLARKETDWVLRDASVRPSTQLERCLFSVFLKHSRFTRLFFGIDLSESRDTLKELAVHWVDTRSKKRVFAFNRALESFRKIAPRYALDDVTNAHLSKALTLLNRTHVRDLLSEKTPVRLDQITELANLLQTSLSAILPTFMKFELKGGKILIFPPADKRKFFDFAVVIQKNDKVFPVCHAGLVRSQIMRLIISEIMRKIKGIEPVLTHGVLSGYDSPIPQCEDDFCEAYEKAFFKKRPLRAGSDLKPENRAHFFKEKYWKVNKEGGRKIFIAFHSAGVSVVEKLLAHNESFKNVIVIIIPDGDWISHYDSSEHLKISANDLSLGHSTHFLVELKRENCFKYSEYFEDDDYFRRKVDRFSQRIKGSVFVETELKEFLRPYVYRFAFEYYAHFFQPEG